MDTDEEDEVIGTVKIKNAVPLEPLTECLWAKLQCVEGQRARLREDGRLPLKVTNC